MPYGVLLCRRSTNSLGCACSSREARALHAPQQEVTGGRDGPTRGGSRQSSSEFGLQPERHAPAGLCLSRRHAGHPRSAPTAATSDAQTGDIADAYPGIPLASIMCPRLGRRTPTRRTATALPSGLPIPPCRRVLKSPSRCLTTLLVGSVIWH